MTTPVNLCVLFDGISFLHRSSDSFLIHANTQSCTNINRRRFKSSADFLYSSAKVDFWNPQTASLECEWVREGIIFLSEEAPVFRFSHIIQIDWNVVCTCETLCHSSENAEETSNLPILKVFFVIEKKDDKTVQNTLFFQWWETPLFISVILGLIPCL